MIEITVSQLLLSAVLVFMLIFFMNKLAAVRRKTQARHPIDIPANTKPTGFEPFASETEASVISEKLWHQEETAFVFKLNEQISSTFERRLICRYVIEEITRFLNTNISVLFLKDNDSELLRMEYAIGLGPDRNGSSFKKGESIAGVVMETREPLMINNLENDFFYKSINKEDYLKDSFISVPLVIQHEAVGVLEVAQKKNGFPFVPKDLALLENVARVVAISIKNSRLLEDIQEGYLRTITTLALIIDARDPYTKRHSENVTRYSLSIADEMRLPEEQKETLRRASLLHDIGKIAIRDDVLLKPGKLTDTEFEQIKTHSVWGEEIVKSLPFLKAVSVLVRHHHERYDGRGYPDGKKSGEIEIGARIMAVADTFDAMTTDRPYRKALTLTVASEELGRNKSSQFDPEVVDCFLKILERDPAILQKDRSLHEKS
jgi:putative nucleotidyltransferase with HDIG domain